MVGIWNVPHRFYVLGACLSADGLLRSDWISRVLT
jgi:hypothetical protein